MISINIPFGWSSLVKLDAAFRVIVFAVPACAVPVSVVAPDAVRVILPLAADGVIV